MEMAVRLAQENVQKGIGGPFGTVITHADTLIATGVNLVTSSLDPSAHAEITAIRAACQAMRTFQLDGCVLYTSCEPCPMCLGAIYWARIPVYYFCSTRSDAATAGFDDAFIYDEVPKPPPERTTPGLQLCSELALLPFEEWIRSANKIRY
jgi:tRNA(Arg) A34 adenosine deaminase TadA